MTRGSDYCPFLFPLNVHANKHCRLCYLFAYILFRKFSSHEIDLPCH
jgi:hypothetical protein